MKKTPKTAPTLTPFQQFVVGSVIAHLRVMLSDAFAYMIPLAPEDKREGIGAAGAGCVDLVDEIAGILATTPTPEDVLPALIANKRKLMAKVAAIASQFSGEPVKVEELEEFFAGLRALREGGELAGDGARIKELETELTARDARITSLEAELAAARAAAPAAPAAVTPRAAMARLKSVTESLTGAVEELVMQGELSDKSADLQAEVRAFVRAAGVGEMEVAPVVPAGMSLEDLPRVIGDFAHAKGADPLLKKAAAAAKALCASLARDAAAAAREAARAAKEEAAARKAGLPAWNELLGFTAPKAAAA